MTNFPDEPADGLLARSVVIIVPLLYLVIVLITSPSFAPWGLRVDPESAYAMNGIVAALGYPFMKSDHPGTTTILVVDIIVRVWMFLTRQSDVAEFGLKNYDAIIYAARAAEALILSAALTAGGIIVRGATRSAVAAVLFQVSPFLRDESFLLQMSLTPESLMISFAILATAIAVKASLGDKPPTIALGVAAGVNFALGLSTKYLFLALAPLGLCFIGNIRALIAAVVTAVLAFVLFNKIFSPFVFAGGFHWLVALATHKGKYGEGETGFIDFDMFWSNVADIIASAPLVCALFPLAALIGLAWMAKSRRILDPLGLTLLGACLAFLVLLAATSKHFAVHYMMASWSLTGGVLVLSIVGLRRLVPALPPSLLAAAAASVCGFLVWTTLSDVRREASEQTALDAVGAKLSKAVVEAGPSCANVSRQYVGAPENEFAHGGDWTFGLEELKDQFGQAYVRLFGAPVLDQRVGDNLLQKNFKPTTYRALAAEYPCIVVRSIEPLNGPADFLAMNPDHCAVAGIEVYTTGIACAKIRDAFQSL
jgi:hypothetical protein